MKISAYSVLIAGALLSVIRLPAGHDEEEGDPRFRTMDVNGDGRVSMAEHRAGARGEFTALDEDRDGFVTATEWGSRSSATAEKSIRFSPASPATDDEGRLNSGAARADGSVSPNEVANARTRAPAAPADGGLRQADRDGDGRLNAEEYESHLSGQFGRRDADGDGYLNRAEWNAPAPAGED